MALQVRNQLWDSGYDESVEVNQRALIDKVLARYSGEFTVFRELLQNSDDAQSNAVEIRFETKAYLDRKANSDDAILEGSVGQSSPTSTSLPNLKTALVHQWTFKNDGIAFRDEDWNRLKKIAEGNPDEEKIGAFGVGFYSLFSVTEEPFVTSAGQWMGFHWKKDQLFARRGKLPDAHEPSRWTSFEMELREDTPIPIAFDFTRFLASSITFMSHLSEVSVYFDDKRLVKLIKSPGLPKELGLQKSLKPNSSRMMTVNKLRSTSLTIKAEVMRWVYTSGSEKPPPPSAVKPIKSTNQGGFFASLFSGFGTSNPATPRPATPVETPKPADPLEVDTTSIVLTVFSADVDVHLDQKLALELHRSTKKSPPKKLKYEIIYTGLDEYNASKAEDELQTFATSGSIFQGLRADLDGMGSARIFIGHATGQTTGIGGHMSARFLPTVERESLDLMDRNVAVWNRELLHIGGFVSRAIYEFEMDNITQLAEGVSSTSAQLEKKDVQVWLMNRVVHVLKFFTFHQSTPSADVSSLLESAFFSCANGFRILSSVGIRDAADIRLPDAQFSSFLRDLPVLPQEIMSGARPMITALQNRKLVKPIMFNDVLKELSSRPLTEDESIACLTWWIKINAEGDNSRLFNIRTQLLDAAVLTVGIPGSSEERLVPLNSIQLFHNPRSVAGSIPLDAPYPSNMLPPSISRKFTPNDLSRSFPWSELTILEWVKFVVTSPSTTVEYNINLSASWAERVLGVLVRAWSSLSGQMKGDIVELLQKTTCMPTSNGMKAPEEAYFANADIFHDLPVVKLPSGNLVKGSTERVLTALGVRNHVDLQIIFTRMVRTNEWTISDLIKYLVSVRDSLSTEEMTRLKMTPAFSAETVSTESGNAKVKRYKADQLYEPVSTLKQLGLPVLDWGKKIKWRSTSEEAKLLYEVGLQRYPPLRVIVELCASHDPEIRSLAFKYLLDNVKTKYESYTVADFHNVKFIPAIKGSAPYLGSPEEVFSSSDWAVLGLPVLSSALGPDVGIKLQLREHPTSAFLVSFLEKTPPRDETQARKYFSILAGRVPDFSSSQLARMSQLPMIPTREKKGDGFQLQNMRPSQCFFGQEGQEGFHSKLFVFIDFGATANSFLSACGVKREPSVEEVAQMLLADPHKFYELAGGPNSFLSELRNIAVNSRLLSSGTLARLKKAPVLLASQRKLSKNEKQANHVDEEDDWDVQYDLKQPSQIVIADDTNALQLFGDALFTAPQEDILEGFYLLLGAVRLSSLVKEEYRVSGESKSSQKASKIQMLIIERLPLFLHEHTHAKTKASFSWLSTNGNFVVKTFGSISVVKSLRFGNLALSKTQSASAVGKRLNFGPIQIWLAENIEPDMYEIATSFNRLFFESPKANDALLFMTILSTDLQALKRRGYNVERIERKYREQRAEQRKAAEDAKAQALISKPPAASPAPAPLLPGSFPTMTVSEPPEAPHEAIDGPEKATSRPSSVLSPLRQLGKRLGRKGPEAQLDSEQVEEGTGLTTRTGTSIPPQGTTQLGEANPGSEQVKGLQTGAHTGNTRQGTTPLGDISANIDMAIKACRPESGFLLRNRERMQKVTESLNEGYCDISGYAEDLIQIGKMGSVSVYISREVPDKDDFMKARRAPLARFIHIMTSLAQVYELPLTSLHLFYDLSGPKIAFNRDASIFLNLRYYQSWHDHEVSIGKYNTALVSWFFTLAHEIAHNLVQQHNSEHEFYFSAICEKYIIDLGSMLAKEDGAR